jgi:hypothetical protein
MNIAFNPSRLGASWGLALAFCLSALFAGPALADPMTFTIDGRVTAVFAGSPQFTGTLGSGQNQFSGYNYYDKGNVIVYSLSYQIGRYDIPATQVQAVISGNIDGQVRVSPEGKLAYRSVTSAGPSYTTYYRIDYVSRGIPVRKFAALILRNGQFYQWSVQDNPGYSKQSAEDLFNAYIKYFSIN